MSDFWNGWIIAIVVINLVGSLWLLLANSKMSKEEAAKKTTGHIYDGIEERNMPLPRWWMILFLATLAFSVVYLVLYPGFGRYEGTLGWTSTGQWQNEVDFVEKQTAPLFDEYAKVPIEELAEYPEALEVGGRLFANNCATCHASDARGAKGFPSLADNAWLYGGSPDAIVSSITKGRNGMMPPMGAALGSDEAIREVAMYVASLSRPDLKNDPAKAALIDKGATKFAFCAACHGADGTGNPMLGAPNLTDNAWVYGGTLSDIEESIRKGRNGVMPAHEHILSPEKIHVLAAYVYSLSR